MANEEAVFRAADGLLAKGKVVSIRAVRASLPNGGSNTTIGPFLTAWKRKRGYQPRVEVADVPTEIKKRHGDALAALWGAACVTAASKYDHDRERNSDALRASEAVRDEALEEADRLTAEVSALKERIDRLETLLREKDARLDRIRSEEFWDRVMREIYGLLPLQGGMTIKEILPLLRDTVNREAAHHKEDVTASVLRTKMMTRVAHGKYFEALGDGRFVKLALEDSSGALNGRRKRVKVATLVGLDSDC